MRVIILLVFLLSSCSFLKRYAENPIQGHTGEGCPAGHWQEAGEKDGKQGFPLSKISRYQKKCQPLEHKPNIAEYKKGRAKGLELYCQPGIGQREGLRNTAYHNVCPEKLEEDFLFQYNLGRQIIKTQSQLQKIESEEYRLNNDFIGDMTSQDQKKGLKMALQKLAIKKSRLRKKLGYLQAHAIEPSKDLLEALTLQ